MTRNEILLNLFKSSLEPRVESLERDNTSHSSDLKICNNFVKEIDRKFFYKFQYYSMKLNHFYLLILISIQRMLFIIVGMMIYQIGVC